MSRMLQSCLIHFCPFAKELRKTEGLSLQTGEFESEELHSIRVVLLRLQIVKLESEEVIR